VDDALVSPRQNAPVRGSTPALVVHCGWRSSPQSSDGRAYIPHAPSACWHGWGRAPRRTHHFAEAGGQEIGGVGAFYATCPRAESRTPRPGTIRTRGMARSRCCRSRWPTLQREGLGRSLPANPSRALLNPLSAPSHQWAEAMWHGGSEASPPPWRPLDHGLAGARSSATPVSRCARTEGLAFPPSCLPIPVLGSLTSGERRAFRALAVRSLRSPQPIMFVWAPITRCRCSPGITGTTMGGVGDRRTRGARSAGWCIRRLYASDTQMAGPQACPRAGSVGVR